MARLFWRDLLLQSAKTTETLTPVAAKKREYTRLSGSGTGLASRSKLWLGTGHLLAITSTGYWENYRRFYFRDIQAFVIRPNNRGRIANIVFAVLASLPLLSALVLAIGYNPDYELALFWGIIAGIFLACLAINTFRGPTCRVHVKTAVQMEELPSLRRLKRVNELLNFLQPLITEAQGEFPPPEVAPASVAPVESPEPPPPAAS